MASDKLNNDRSPSFLHGDRRLRLVEMANSGARGFIIPIGGAEKRVRDVTILRGFVQLCGGGDAHIAVVPSASALPDTGRKYEQVFRDLGVGRVSILDIESRVDCESNKFVEQIDRVDGVFMTGGDQQRLSSILHGTPFAARLRARNSVGMHIAGTSAGAAVMSKYMIAGGQSGSTPRPDMVELTPGVGLLGHLVIDQHFRQRDRLGRLLTALAYYPDAVGIGLDEDTAAFIAPDMRLDVVGSGGITIVDPAGMKHSVIDPADRHVPVSMIDLRVHILVNGAAYDLQTRTPYSARITREKIA